MNQKPNRKWAYAILERAKKGRDKYLTPCAIRIAEEAVRMDQLGKVKEEQPGQEAA